MTTDPTSGWLRNANAPASLPDVSDAKRRRDVEFLQSLVVTTTLAEAYGHSDISRMLATVCVRFAQKIGAPPPVDLVPGNPDR